MALKYSGNLDSPVRKRGKSPINEKNVNNKETNVKKEDGNKSPRKIREKEIEESQKPRSNKKLLIIAGGVIVVVGVFAISKIIGSSNASKVNEQVIAKQQEQIVQPITNTGSKGNKNSLTPTSVDGVYSTNTKPENISSPDNENDRNENVIPGSPNLKSDNNIVNGAPVEGKVKLVQDMKGDPIDINWQIASITNVSDFINYEKKRSIMSTGMELFWLECTYKDGRPYRVTVPFSVFKELEPKGITVVDVEVAVLKDGQSVVTYMSVNPEYKQLIIDKKKQEREAQGE